MIYYFSGTGNSEWVAKEIAKSTSDEAVNIVKAIQTDKNTIRVKKGETIGLVFPIYAWAAPEIVINFIKTIELEEGSYAYAVSTCGEEAGCAMKNLSKMIKLDSLYSIVMPSNYVIGYDVDAQEIVDKKISTAKKQIEKFSEDIKAKKSSYAVTEGKMPSLKSTIIAPLFNKFARSTKSFKVDDTCIGCGICENNCPTGCISLNQGKPVWGNKCYQCLSCINRCPKQAIQYGNNTKKRGRYFMKL